MTEDTEANVENLEGDAGFEPGEHDTASAGGGEADIETALAGDDDKPKTLKDSVRAAWNKHKAELATLQSNEPQPGKPKTGAERDKQAQAQRARQTPVKAGDAQTSAGAQGAPAPTTAAPKGWSAEARAAWDGLPDAVKTAVAKLEQSTQHGLQQLKARHDAYDREVAKLDPVFQKHGRDRTTGLQNLVAWAQAVESNPAANIAQLLRSYNVPFQAIAQAYGVQLNQPGQPNGQVTQQQQRPQFDLRAAVQPLLAPLTAELNQLKQARTNEAQAASDAMVNSWAKDKPHFDAVRQTMKTILDVAVNNGTVAEYLGPNGAPDLDKLYDQAVHMNPETRQAVLAERAKGQQTQQRQQAQRAKRAGASLRPGSPSTDREPDRNNLSPRDRLRFDIRNAMEAVANR